MKMNRLTVSMLAMSMGVAAASDLNTSDNTAVTPIDATQSYPLLAYWDALSPKVIEIEAVGAISGTSGIPDLWGTRFTMALYKDSQHSFTHEMNVGFGLLWGSETGPKGDYEQILDMFEIPVAVGYNAHYEFADNWSVYAGGKLGLSYIAMTTDMNAPNLGPAKDRTGQFKWSVGTGVTYSLSQSVYVKLGYEFTHAIYDTTVHVHEGGVRTSVEEMDGQHIISLGVGITF